MVTVSAERGYGHRNRKLEIVASRGEALRRSELVAEAELVRDQERKEENDHEVDDQWRGDPYHGNDLMDDLLSLGREEDEDGVEQADERPWRCPLEEDLIIPLRADQFPYSEPSYYRGTQRYPKEHSNAGCNGRVADGDCTARVADHLYEKYSEWREEDHLEYRVDCDEDRAVLAVAACQTGPDQHLSCSLAFRCHRSWIGCYSPWQYISQVQQESSLRAAQTCLAGMPMRDQAERC